MSHIPLVEQGHSTRPVVRRGLRAAIGCLIVGLALTGCARTVASENLASFGRAANDISQQSDLAFEQSNKLARDVSIDRFVRSGAPGLSEEHFQGAVTRESMGAWQEALSALSDYGTVLSSLVDTKRGAETSDAIVALGNKLQTGQVGLKINPAVATGFASLGGALVDARAQQQARQIIRRADPAVQSILGTMADAIGSSDAEGLRGTIFSTWNESLKPVRLAYVRAAENRQEAAQRQLIAEYLAGLDRRDAQARSLGNLRSSLVNLAAAHAAAAKGAPATVAGLLGQVERRLDETKRIYEAVEKDTKKESANAEQ